MCYSSILISSSLTLFYKSHIQAIHTILNILHKLANNEIPNYSVNLGLRIQFTRGTHNGHLLGVGLESDEQKLGRKHLLLAHITFMGLTGNGPNKLWNDAAKQIILTMLTKIPTCMPQWKTEWHAKQVRFNSMSYEAYILLIIS